MLMHERMTSLTNVLVQQKGVVFHVVNRTERLLQSSSDWTEEKILRILQWRPLEESSVSFIA